MEELKNKTFLVKVRKDLFDYLKSENNFEKVGKLKVLLNKKRNEPNKPEFIFHFNKENGIKDYKLVYNKTNDYIYFGDKETKEGLRVGNIDNFGNLVVNEDSVSDDLIKNAFRKGKFILLKYVSIAKEVLESMGFVHDNPAYL